MKFSITVDECVILALADGFTYVMDERDAEWLVKNNQDARGEGTSSQASGSSSGSGTTTRSGGHRSAKSRGKEAEPNSAIAISEDEFELVMGLFERITHDNTPFLHVVRNLLLRTQRSTLTLIRASNNFKDPAFPLSLIITMFLLTTFRLHTSQLSCVLPISPLLLPLFAWLVPFILIGETARLIAKGSVSYQL